jgi:hypothetical protein
MKWLLSAWGGFKRLLRLALAYPLQAALIALLCLSVWLYWGKQSALNTVADRNATIAQMEQASKIATAAQIALNKANTDKQTEIARLTDANETNRRDIADRSSDYAIRMSGENYCRKASAAAQSDIAESRNGTSADAVMVTKSDFDILTGNTARLADVKAWADRLIGEGLAVPVD